MEIAVLLKIDEQRVTQTLEEAREKLDSSDQELILDFSAVRRIDSAALKSIERFADSAEQKSVKVVVRGMNVASYKVLKLVNLTPRFSFVA